MGSRQGAAPIAQAAPEADFAADVLDGLNGAQKRIPSKYLYDARGSELFERICEQPEYYPTRTELNILREQGAAIAEAVGPRALVLEYGSGSGIKTRLLLDALDAPVAYMPVEISYSALAASARRQMPSDLTLPMSADGAGKSALQKPSLTTNGSRSGPSSVHETESGSSSLRRGRSAWSGGTGARTSTS